MQLTLLKGKIHRAAVTQCDLDYEGSISVDASLMERAGILPNEEVGVHPADDAAPPNCRGSSAACASARDA